MKANHNIPAEQNSTTPVVGNINKSKNESKSQHYAKKILHPVVVGNINKSKNESKSQL